jgi:hypothetical protein
MCCHTHYGKKREYFSDRISVVTHLNLTYEYVHETKFNLITVLAVLLFNQELIDMHQFYVHPQFEITPFYIKQKFFLSYSRSDFYLTREGNELINHFQSFINANL